MTENINAYAQAQRALGLFVGVTTGLSEERQTIINAACAQLDRSLQMLLEAAETPEIVPVEEAAEQPRSPWHRIAIESTLEGYEHRPELHGLVLTFSEEINLLQVLRTTDGVIWRDAEDKLFRGKVDYWMPIPPLFDE